MQVKLSDISTLLGITPKDIDEKCKSLKQHDLFVDEGLLSTGEIEDILMDHQIGLDSSELYEVGTSKFNLFRALLKGIVLDRIHANHQFELIEIATQHIAQMLDLDSKTLALLLIEREKMMSTAIGNGIAVPHTRDFLVPSHLDTVSLVHPLHPINFDALDKQPVHSCFFLFASNPKNHLRLLAKIASFCQVQEHRELLASAPTKRDLLITVRKWEQTL